VQRNNGHELLPVPCWVMAKYIGIFEQAADGTWSGYAPDLPAVLAMGDTLQLAEENMKAGIDLWIEDAKADGDPIPAPSYRAREFEVVA
jgi:predicted RNase H-like HicB family nuclease